MAKAIKVPAPRNPLVALGKFRQAGAHGKSTKALRREQKVRDQISARDDERGGASTDSTNRMSRRSGRDYWADKPTRVVPVSIRFRSRAHAGKLPDNISKDFLPRGLRPVVPSKVQGVLPDC